MQGYEIRVDGTTVAPDGGILPSKVRAAAACLRRLPCCRAAACKCACVRAGPAAATGSVLMARVLPSLACAAAAAGRSQAASGV